MANDSIYENPNTGERVQWNGKAWVPMAKAIVSAATPDAQPKPPEQVESMQTKFQAKPVGPPPGAAQRLVTGVMGVPEDTTFRTYPRSAAELAAGPLYGLAREVAATPELAHFDTWKNAVQQALSFLNPVGGMPDATKASVQRFNQPGFWNKAAGTTEGLLSGIPLEGPAAVNAMEKSAHGDVAGGIGSAIPAGLMAAGVFAGAPALAESQWVQSPVRSAIAAAQGLGVTGENLGAADFAKRAQKTLESYHQDIAKADEAYKQQVAKVGENNTAARAAHQLEVQKARNKYTGALADLREQRQQASAAQSEATVKSKTLNSLSGPVYQRLAGMAQQVYDNANNLFNAIKTRNTANWGAWRVAMGDAQVPLRPVQQAVIDAEANILKGSPENIKVFRSLLKEGQPKGGAFVDDGPGKENLQAVPSDESIPVDDMRGYGTELGNRLYGSGELPGDVRRAMHYVQDAIDDQVTQAAKERGQDAAYKRLKNEYAQYAGDFLDRNGPFRKLLNAVSPKDKIDTIVGDTGRELTDAMGKYAKDFNLNQATKGGWTPFEWVQKARGLRQQVVNMSRTVPEIGEPPTLKKVPEPEMEQPPEPPVHQPPNVPGFDPRQWRLNEMTERAKRYVHPSQYEMGAFGMMSTPFRRAWATMMTNPVFREWMADYNHPGPKFQPFTGPIPPASGGSQRRMPAGAGTGDTPFAPMSPLSPAEKATIEQQAGRRFATDMDARMWWIMHEGNNILR